MKRIIILLLLTACLQGAFASVYYVSATGNDVMGNGNSTSPWRTLKFAVTQVSANQGHTIQLSAGTFVENGQFNVPPGVSILGAGMDQTFVKAASSFYYNPTEPGFAYEKFLMTLTSSSSTNGNQSLKNFTIDGDGKKLHGGIFAQNRNNLVIDNVKVQYVNFCGLWLIGVNYSTLTGLKFKDCAWGSVGWCSGNLHIANSSNIDVSGFDIDESRGYGIKNLGHTSNTPFSNIKIHDGRVSVNPRGLWNNGSSPNITIEIWASSFPGTEIYNCYVNNLISLVTHVNQRSTGLKVYNNTFDVAGRGYAIECSINDVEIYNNWFNGGSTSIVNWHDIQLAGWNIHHNTFYGLSNTYPSAIINSNKGGINDSNISNNTVEMTGTSTINFIEFNHRGVSNNIKIKNNLIINSNTGYAWYPNKFISLEDGASVNNVQASNNWLSNMAIGNVGGSYSNNFTGDPKISKTNARPNPYYLPGIGSPLIDGGTNVGYSFTGSLPDIGAFESTSAATTSVTGVSITPGTLLLGTNATAQLSKTISPSNATNQNVSWTSSNMSVATVSAAGFVTAGSISGTTTITCTTSAGSKTANAAVTVTAPIAVATVSINSPISTLSVGATSQLTKVIGPANATNQNVTWTSSNPAVASINSNGLVTAFGPGSATITTTTVDGGKTSTTPMAVISSGNIVNLDNASVGSGQNQFNFSGTGWTHAANTADPYFQKTCSFANISSNTVTVTFSGSKVEFYAAKAAHHGIAAVSIDNGPETTVDQYAGTRQDNVMLYSNGNLTPGTHTIKIRVTGSKNVSATGTYVIIDYLKVYASPSVPATSTTVDLDNATRGTAANQFNFFGTGWNNAENTSDPYFQSTVSFSNTANNYVTVLFNGNKVEFYSSKAAHHGMVAVSIDNGPESNVDLYAATRQNFVMAYSSGTLTDGAHTIKLRVTGNKNAMATGTYAIIDYLKVYATATGGGGGSYAMSSSFEETSPGIHYFPNPIRAGGILHVNLSEASGNVTVVNLAGVPQQTLEVTDKETQISTAGFVPGIYLLQHQTSRGREVVKILVQ